VVPVNAKFLSVADYHKLMTINNIYLRKMSLLSTELLQAIQPSFVLWWLFAVMLSVIQLNFVVLLNEVFFYRLC
jgi:hypothetical protein